MSRDLPPYRRAVLGMGAGGVDRDVLRTVAEFARLLHLEMLGLFIEDRSLLALAALPFARELRLPGHAWRALEVQGIGDELRAAALRARKLFEEEFEPQGIAYSFEVQRGDPAILSGSLARATDILIVVQPHAAEMLASGWEPTRWAAATSAAAVLLLPRSGMPRRGPIAAIAASNSDPSFQLAARLAAAMGEKALAIPSGDPACSAALLASLHRALGLHQERLLILPREAATPEELPLELAGRRRVPILIMNTEQQHCRRSCGHRSETQGAPHRLWDDPS